MHKKNMISILCVVLFAVFLFVCANRKISEEIVEISENTEEIAEISETIEEIVEISETSEEIDYTDDETEQVGEIVYEGDQFLCRKILDEGEMAYELVLYSKTKEEVQSIVHLKEPGIGEVTENILEIGLSVGSPATYVLYFNKETLAISDPYFNPIQFGDQYVAYMEDGKIILTDLFQEGLFSMTIERDFSSSFLIPGSYSIEMIDDESIKFTYPEGEAYTYVTEIITLGTGESSKYIELSQEDIESLGNTQNIASMNYLVSKSKISEKIINEKKEYIQNYFLNLLRVPEGISNIELNETVSRQIQTIPWDSLDYDRCVCHFVSAYTFDDGSQTYWGYVLLDNSTERWEEQKSLVFIEFVYFPTENDRILLDEISWTDDGFSKEIWSYDTETLEDSVHGSGVRLLDKTIEIYPYDKVEPQTNLKDEDLEQYIGKIFLDICRYPKHIEKYEKILTSESIKLLESVEWYYYYPEKFYDAAWEIDGDVYVGSQFSPAVWGGGCVAEPAITYQYEPETGKIKILEFEMGKWWYR